MDTPTQSFNAVDEHACRQFRAAWNEGGPTSIDSFLPSDDDPRRLSTLQELICIEMELFWRGCQSTQEEETKTLPPLVEAYLARYPQLKEPGVIQRLLQREYQVRQEFGDRPQGADVQQRYRDIIAGLSSSEITRDEAETIDHPNITPQTRPQPYPSIPGYEVLGELGHGGMGVVYKARQISLKRLVALKMILSGGHARPQDLARFRTEAEAVAQLQHPNIVQIYEIGEHDGLPYFSLEYVDGGNLAGKLSGSSWSPRQAAALLETLARAMQAAHQRGVIHRDLKPANVLLTSDGLPKITDFGLAKRLDDDSGQTRTGDVMGTPSYMAPEQAGGLVKQISPAVDVYALGAILYQMMVGNPPFRADSPMDTVIKVLTEEPVPPRKLNPTLPRDLETICLKCLAKEPARRYTSALTLSQDLERFQAGEPILARRENIARRMWRKVRRRPLLSAAMLGLLALAVSGFITWRSMGVYHQASVNRQLSAALSDFDAALEARHWPAEHLQQMDSLISTIEQLDPNQAGAARRRLNQRFAEVIRQSMKPGRLSPSAIARIDQQILRLERRSPELAESVRQFKAKRFRDWETVFDSQAPFPQLKQIFHPSQVQIKDRLLMRSSANREEKKAPLFTRIPCQGDAKLEAVFDESWLKAEEIGLMLHASQGNTGAPVECLAFSPDGRTLAAGSAHRIHLWDIASGKMQAALEGHQNDVRALVFSSDGKHLTSISRSNPMRNGQQKRWDLKTREEVPVQVRNTPKPITASAFSSDRTLLAVTSRGQDGSGRVHIRDAATGVQRQLIQASDQLVFALAFSTDGKRLATGSYDSIKVWDVRTGKRLNAIPPIRGFVTSLAFSHDGKTLIGSDSSGNLRLWDSVSGRLIWERMVAIHKRLHTVIFSPHDDKVAASDHGGTVHLVDAKTGLDYEAVHAGLTQGIRAIAFDREGGTLAYGNDGGNIVLIYPGTRQERDRFGGSQNYTFMLSAWKPSLERRSDKGVQRGRAGNTFEEALQANNKVRLQIYRNGVRQREEMIPIRPGPLRLMVSREGNRLSFQVNHAPAVEFHDVMPLSGSSSAVHALHWPANVGLSRLQAAFKPKSALPSLLESADEFFQQREFDKALSLYQQESLNADDASETGKRLRREASVKSALCLIRLNRAQEAIPLLNEAALAPDETWSLIAVCHLWLLRLLQDPPDYDAAEHLLPRIEAVFPGQTGFKSIAKLIPEDMRRRIHLSYQELGRKDRFLLFDPRQLYRLKRADEVNDMFQAPVADRLRTKHHLLWAYRLTRQTEEARRLAELIVKAGRSPIETATDHHWMLREAGMSKQGLAELDRLLNQPRRKVNRPALLLEKARFHVALKQWKQAEKDLDECLMLAQPHAYEYYLYASARLMQGFLRERRGDRKGAQESWRAGLYKSYRASAEASKKEKPPHPVIPFAHICNLLLGSLTRSITDAEAKAALNSMTARYSSYSGQTAHLQFMKLVPFNVSIFRQICRTELGKQYARALAYRSLTYPEYLRGFGILTGACLSYQQLLKKMPTPEQERLVVRHMEDLLNSLAMERLSKGQLIQLGLAWKGFISVHALSKQFDPTLLGPMYYMTAMRLLGSKPKNETEARKLLHTALKHADEDPLLQRLIQKELEKLEGKELRKRR